MPDPRPDPPCAAQPRDAGQAAVELALALPVVVVMLLGIVQVVAVVGDRLAVELAAREGARAAAVAGDPSGAAAAAASRATGLTPLDVATTVRSDRVTVTVSHRSRTDVPIIGRLIRDVVVESTVSMRREPP